MEGVRGGNWVAASAIGADPIQKCRLLHRLDVAVTGAVCEREGVGFVY